jgi:hypothetical protein
MAVRLWACRGLVWVWFGFRSLGPFLRFGLVWVLVFGSVVLSVWVSVARPRLCTAAHLQPSKSLFDSPRAFTAWCWGYSPPLALLRLLAP